MALFPFHRYQLVDERSKPIEESSSDQSHNPNVKHRCRSITVVLTTAAFLVTVIASCFAFGHFLTSDDHATSNSNNDSLDPQTEIIESPYLPCGRNHTEARAAGCIYDIMMNSWLQPDCYDEELSADFQSLRDWAFYADVEATHRLTVEEISQRTQAHTVGYYHFVHCIYSLRKVQRAIAQGRMIEEDAASMHHDGHCKRILQNGVRGKEQPSEVNLALYEINTQLNIGYPRCVTPKELLEKRYDVVFGHSVHNH